MNTNPLIELTIDEMDESKPTPGNPYVWIVEIANRSGCAIDCDYYTEEEAPEKLREFFDEIGATIYRTTYEAIGHKFHDIDGDDAVDAICMGLSRYFEGDDCIVENTYYDAPFDVDFAITTAWDGKTMRFTLHPDGEISLPEG